MDVEPGFGCRRQKDWPRLIQNTRCAEIAKEAQLTILRKNIAGKRCDANRPADGCIVGQHP